jgi:hypothetical protein
LHSWATASRSMQPASEFWHPISQFGTGAFRYRTGSPYSGAGLDFRHWNFCSLYGTELFFSARTNLGKKTREIFALPNLLDAGQSDIPAFKKAVVGGSERDTQFTSKLQVVESDTPCTSIDSC